jgi:hypothetical protein
MTNLDTILTQIANKHLYIDTLETRNCDQLDFHEVAVWSVRKALEAAYLIGVAEGVHGARHRGAPLGTDSFPCHPYGAVSYRLKDDRP